MPLSAVYAFVSGGIAGAANADILYVHDLRGGPGAPFTLPVPPPPGALRAPFNQWAAKPPEAFAPFQFGTPGVFIPRDSGQRIVTTRCDEKDGVRTCTTTERSVPLDEAVPLPQPGSTAPSPPAVVPGFRPIGFQWIATAPDRVVAGPGSGTAVQPFNRPVMRGWLGGAALLSVASLLLLLGVLYNFERMLAAFETGIVFSAETVRLLQRAGVLVSAAAFLPQLDVYALLRDALVSVLTFTPMMPMAVGFPTNTARRLVHDSGRTHRR